jgi:hypothetical protein
MILGGLGKDLTNGDTKYIYIIEGQLKIMDIDRILYIYVHIYIYVIPGYRYSDIDIYIHKDNI